MGAPMGAPVLNTDISPGDSHGGDYGLSTSACFAGRKAGSSKRWAHGERQKRGKKKKKKEENPVSFNWQKLPG